MSKYWRLLAHDIDEGTAYVAAAGTLQTSPYTPDEDARLIGLRVVIGRAAATTLTDEVQFKMTCTTFKPNTLHAMGVGTGLQTAPAVGAPVVDHVVDQAVKAGVPITIEARRGNGSGVTNNNYLMGLFES